MAKKTIIFVAAEQTNLENIVSDFFEVSKRLRLLISIILRGSFHVPKPKINSVHGCDFRPDFVTANLPAMSTKTELVILQLWINGERLESDTRGFISWIVDAM